MEVRDRMLVYAKTDHQHKSYDKHASHSSQSSFSGSSEEMTNPLMSQNSSSDNEKNVSLNGGSVELLDDGVSFYFTPSIGKQITMRCPDQSTAQKWVHSITVALSQDTWDSYVHGQARQEGGAGGGAARMRSPSAHAMVAAGSANNQAGSYGGNARRGPRQASGSMSENDIVQSQVIENLLDSYYDIVRTKIQDSVPKAITLKLVNEVKKVLHSELVSTMYGNEEKINQLLAEAEGAQRKREQLQAVLALMEEAMLAVQEVQVGM